MRDAKITVNYPPGNTCWGVWLGDNQNDVHIDFEHRSIVLGANKDIPKMKFAPQALIFREDGTIAFQFADGEGNAKHAPLKPDTVYAAFSALLNDLEAKARAQA